MANPLEELWKAAGYDEYTARALATQRGVIDRELEQRADSGERPYDRSGVRQAIVHTRQDMVLLASYLNDLNRQARTIRRLLLIAVILLAILAWVTFRSTVGK